jgi:signal transduction histidine kinase
MSSHPALLDADRALTPWAVEITLSNPYTVRASTLAAVTGLFLVVGAVAFIVSVAVAAFLARRFTTPLRRLTTAAKDLELGELGSRVPTRLAATGATEISELSRQFNAMADRLEESVTIIRRDRDRSRDFLADVSHELRTPIAALRTFNELLSEGADDDPETRAEFLESSRQQLERLDWLAQNLLDLSKLDSGLVLPDFRPDDLRAAVESAVEQAQATARKRGIELSVSLPPRPVRIRHDPQRIGQVVNNLVGNSLKFTPRGGSVVVELRPIPDGARIEVRDSGIGIDASEMPRIFDRFYRGSLANEARGSGSGLGLAIVKSIVDLHAGRITVESRLGSGTTVVVTLPKDPRTAEVGGARDDAGGLRGPRGPRADIVVPADAPTGEVADSSPSDQS